MKLYTRKEISELAGVDLKLIENLFGVINAPENKFPDIKEHLLPVDRKGMFYYYSEETASIICEAIIRREKFRIKNTKALRQTIAFREHVRKVDADVKIMSATIPLEKLSELSNDELINIVRSQSLHINSIMQRLNIIDKQKDGTM